MNYKFTENAAKVINYSQEVAGELQHNYVGTEHLLIGLLEAEGVAKAVLEKNGVTKDKIMELVRQLISSSSTMEAVGQGGFTPRSKRIIEQSLREAGRLKSQTIGTEHILLALLKETDCIAVRLINSLGVNIQKLYIDILTAVGADAHIAKNEFISNKNKSKGKSSTPTLDQYSKDLTEYSKEGKLDPVIGRDSEIQRVIQILSRRTKNNPILIGEAGVGKTAIAEGLANKVIEGSVPELIKDKRVISLDLTGMVAGSKYRGEFEERIKKAVNEVMDAGDVLLFIDEIHTIIGAGGAEGAIDASNILKPYLARGELQVIGATTIEEYRKYFEKDAALERRFQPVLVDEPTEEESIKILKGLKDTYEVHHKVTITDEAIEAAVELSARYINDRHLPDKAIDLMDEAASKVRIRAYESSPEIKELEEELEKLSDDKELAIKQEEYEKAAEIKDREEELKSEINMLTAKADKERQSKQLVVGEEEIAEIVSDWTKIPVTKLEEEESEKLMNLESILHERVIGQNEAVDAVAKAIRRGRVGLKDPNKPTGSFLFLGPTGVGKTELSKALAEAMFGDETAMIRLDMSEYMEKHSVSKLIGSPPGYVGYDDGGQLSEQVRRRPYSVILFDEIEKAHPDVFNILLQVLDDGHITDSQGRTVSFKNTIIIMTSNAGAQNIIQPKKLGFASEQDDKADYDKMKDSVMEEVKRTFRPEFINRIDEIIVFHALTEKNIREIVDIMISNIFDRSKEQLNVDIEAETEVLDHLAKVGYSQSYGARPLRRAIQTAIEDTLADEILTGNIKNGDTVLLTLEDDKIKINRRELASQQE